jgi:sugar lactone lactonase YvrE
MSRAVGHGPIRWLAVLLALASATCGRKDIQVVASDQFYPYALALDETHVYWANFGDGTIQSVRKDRPGDRPAILVKVNRPSGIAVDRSDLYWADAGLSRRSNDGAIGRVAKQGGPRIVMASSQAFPSGITVDSASVYWTNAGADESSPAGRRGSLVKMTLKGGPPVVLASQLDLPFDPVVLGERIYWRTTQSIMGMPTNGGRAEVMVSKARPHFLRATTSSEGTLIWVNMSTDPLLSDGSIEMMSVGGSEHRVTRLVSGIALVDGLAADDKLVYWAASSGDVFRLPAVGGEVHKISADLGHVSQIAVDGGTLVVLDRNSSDAADGRVLRIKR